MYTYLFYLPATASGLSSSSIILGFLEAPSGGGSQLVGMAEKLEGPCDVVWAARGSGSSEADGGGKTLGSEVEGVPSFALSTERRFGSSLKCPSNCARSCGLVPIASSEVLHFSLFGEGLDGESGVLGLDTFISFSL